MRKTIIPAALALILATVVASIAWGAQDGDAGGIPSENFFVDLNIQEDFCNHDPFIFPVILGNGGGPSHNFKIEINELKPGLVEIKSELPGFPLVGTDKGGGQFVANGQGKVAGFQNTFVDVFLSIDEFGLFGKLSYGTDDPLFPPGEGGLPPCGEPEEPHPAVYDIKPKPPGDTPTPTEEEKFFSIIVLKLNDANNNPLAGFDFNLYEGNDCQGTPVATQTTGSSGLLDFTGLDPGKYSVEEKPKPGWNVVGDECQNVLTPGVVGAPAGVSPCPVQPDAEFPQPGCDTFVSGARVIVEINATGDEFPVTLNGPTQIVRLNKPHKVNGFDRVDTEMVFMELVGASPFGQLTVSESQDQQSLGAITEQENTGPDKMNFPADSFFEIFFEVDIGDGVVLHNQDPFRVECKIEEIPPILCFYQPPVEDPIDLFNDDKVKIAKIKHALHIPLPPKEVLVVFTNEQKGTETPTPTPGTAPTNTPTPGTAPTNTPTPGTAPTNTPTPAADNGNGDVNKDGTVDSVDALLILQDVAGLFTIEHPDNADVNKDGDVDVVDAALILQFVLNLIPGLPV